MLITVNLREHGQQSSLFGTAPDVRLSDREWARRLVSPEPPPPPRKRKRRPVGWVPLLEGLSRDPAPLPAPDDDAGWARRLLEGA
jgi:hypothetical protein